MRTEKGHFVLVGNTNRDKRVRQPRGAGSPLPTGIKGCLLSLLPDPGQKDPLLSRPGVLGWETWTKRVSQPGQIAYSVVVRLGSRIITSSHQ